MSLDPIIMKGIYLLRSKAKDSGQQLKELLDDLIEKSRLTEETLPAKDYDPIDNIEKLKRDIIDLGSPNIYQSKKLKLFDSLAIDKSGNEIDLFNLKETNDYDVKSQDNSLSNDFVEKETFDYIIGIACIICRKSSMTSQNKIIECLDCHSLYHQDCHNPKVLEDVNDPRFVWYCHICTSKEEDISLLIKSPTYTGKEQKPPTPTPKILNKPKRPESLTVFPFKRPEQKSPLHFTPSDSNSSVESFGFKMSDKFSTAINKPENYKNPKTPFKAMSTDKTDGNNIFASKLPTPLPKNVTKKTSLQSPGPKLTGLAGLAANLMRQNSPNNTSPQPSGINTNKMAFVKSSGTISNDNLGRTKNTTNAMVKKPVLSPSLNANKVNAFSRKPSFNLVDGKKKLQASPVVRESSTSASASFNPPTMKDYEKRLQKMKKRKLS